MHRQTKAALTGKKLIPGFRGRVWIDGKEGTFLGYGRVVLLERIKQYGSITQAAKSMEMSYRHAWDLVDSMNRQAKRPFVELATGGRGGGGALVTKEGEEAIQLFWKFAEDFQLFLKHENEKLKVQTMLSKTTKKK
jgi:molybdate transport system regulatory protein